MPFALRSGTIYVLLVEGPMRNISVRLLYIWTSGSGDIGYIYFLSRALAAPLFSRANNACNFGRRHYEEQFCKIIFNLDK